MLKKFLPLVAVVSLSGCVMPSNEYSYWLTEHKKAQAMCDKAQVQCFEPTVEKPVKPKGKEFSYVGGTTKCHNNAIAEFRKELNADLEIAAMGIDNYNNSGVKQKNFSKYSREHAVSICGAFPKGKKIYNKGWKEYNAALSNYNARWKVHDNCAERKADAIKQCEIMVEASEKRWETSVPTFDKIQGGAVVKSIYTN